MATLFSMQSWLVCCIASALAVLVGCSPAYQATDLDGTWTGQDYTINARGKSLTTKQVTLNVDGNGLISGRTSWTLVDGAGGNHLEKPVKRDSEEVIGVFHPETGEFYLVEKQETGIWQGKMLSRNRLHAFLFQSGEKPVVSMIELQRVSD